MDGHQFDRLTQQMTQALTRRRFGAVLAALGFGAGLGAAPKVKAKKKKKKKKPKPCANGAARCGTACVDTQTNAQHCGGCGQPCIAGQSCVAGACQGGGGCTGGREQCATECVDLDNDERHCGECNRACAGDLTCLSGDCGCAAGTKCGTECVNLQTNNLHCGACGAPCNVGQCVGGQCVQVGGYPCDDVYDCGGNYRGVVCRNGQCACEKSEEGLCYDPRQGSYAICNVCCPGGSRNCPGDRECNGPSSPTATCSCASYEDVCDYGEPHRCSQDQATDPNRCGINCTDCTERGPTSFCCFGECLTACEPNTNCNLRTCGGCQTCTGNTACCRVGTSHLFGCALLVNGLCPGPPP